MISGNVLKDAIISGANNIINNKTSVDDLNIFPVPDGDTGTNMSMTIGAAAEKLAGCDCGSAADAASAAASAMLRGARGNSGVILSLLFRGFSKGVEGLDSLSGKDILSALSLGVKAAYNAVMRPTEGTMLTVSRVACEEGKAALEDGDDPVHIWEAMCAGAQAALQKTPQLLPVLKRAGVVDAGGKGLCYILDGMLSVFRDGKIIELETEKEKQGDDASDGEFFKNAAAEFDTDIRFTYCTEFIIGRSAGCERDPQELRTFLETIGDCVLVVADEEIIKVHVHTENPGKALEAALGFGQLLKVKVDNMKEQHRKAAEQAKQAPAKAEAAEELQPAEPSQEIGFVAVAAGDGLESLFKDLGCTHVVSGGQTMNPSTAEMLAAVKATPAKNVFIIPNNKNIIMSAEQVIPLVTDRKVVVLPTRTIAQGLSALLAYDPSAAMEANTVGMMEAASAVTTGNVTFAARDSEFGGRKIHRGDIMGLVDGKLELVEKDNDIVRACVRLTRSMINRGTAFITLLYGEGVTEQMANEAYGKIKARAGENVEVTLVKGGQPVYYFIISVE